MKISVGVTDKRSYGTDESRYNSFEVHVGASEIDVDSIEDIPRVAKELMQKCVLTESVFHVVRGTMSADEAKAVVKAFNNLADRKEVKK